jgi:hypothetical protein
VTVTKIRPEEWTKDGEKVVTYWLTLEGREKAVPCYDPRAAELKVGEPLPDGWSVVQSKKGKDYVKTPAAQRGQSAPAFRNTKEGFLAEQEGRLRWQWVEEERRDRRTALMQAAAFFDSGVEHSTDMVAGVAGIFYEWLRQPVQPRGEPQEKGAGKSSPVDLPNPSERSGSPDERGDGAAPTTGGDTTSGEEQGRPSLPGSPSVSTDTSPDTAEGGTSSEEGEAVARSAQASGVKSPSRRCLHLKGTKTVTTPSGGRNEVCVECGFVIDRVETSA